jgi:hypothetical protein
VASRETDTVSYMVYTRHVASRGTKCRVLYCTWGKHGLKRSRILIMLYIVHGARGRGVNKTSAPSMKTKFKRNVDSRKSTLIAVVATENTRDIALKYRIHWHNPCTNL